jgi:hypothetical protein
VKFSGELKKLREQMQTDYEGRMRDTLQELDKYRQDLEKATETKIAKINKEHEAQLFEKEEDISRLT